MVVGMRTVVDIQADLVALLRQLDRAGAGADMRTLRTDGPDTRANIEEYAPLWSLAPPSWEARLLPASRTLAACHQSRSTSSGACPHSNQRIGHRFVRHPFLLLLVGGMPHSCCA